MPGVHLLVLPLTLTRCQVQGADKHLPGEPRRFDVARRRIRKAPGTKLLLRFIADAATLLDRQVEPVRSRVVGRRHPIRRSGRGWADKVALQRRLHARHADRPAGLRQAAGPVQLVDERYALEKLTGLAVKNVVETVAVGMHQKLSWTAFVGSVDQNRDLYRIPIMQIVRRELKIPFELAAVGVQRDNRLGIKVVSSSRLAVEVRRRVPDAPVEQVQFGIEAPREPRRSAAGLPRIAGPGFVAGLTRTRNRVEPPQPFSRRGVEGVQPAVESVVARRVAGDDPAVNRKRCCRRPVAVLGTRNLRFPHHAPGAGIESDEMSVRRGDIDKIPQHRDAAIVASLAGRLPAPFPDLAAGAGIQRVYLIGLAHVHHAVHDDGNAFQPPRSRHGKDPGGRELTYVFLGDLIEWTVPLRVVGAAVREPIVRRWVEKLFVGDLPGQESCG